MSKEVHEFPDCIFKPRVLFVTTRRAWKSQVKHYGYAKLNYPPEDGHLASTTRLTFKGASPVIIIATQSMRKRSNAMITETCAHEATHIMRFICENVGEPFLGFETEAHLIGALTKWMWPIMKRQRK